MEKVKNIYNSYKKQIILSIIFLGVICFSLLSFIHINSRFNSANEPNKKTLSLSLEKEDLTSKEDSSKIKVDIKGFVKNPGVYELNQNDRVIDAISKAGGLESNAYTRYINLSKKLSDEFVIIINSKEEIDLIKKGDNKKQICEELNDTCIIEDKIITNDYKEIKDSIEDDKELNTIVNINTATKEELMTLSGIGEKKALEIIEYRNINGKFNSTLEIKNIKGIGESMYEKIKDYICV